MGLSSIKGVIDNINLFSVIMMLSCVVCFFIVIGFEGVYFIFFIISVVGVSV